MNSINPKVSLDQLVIKALYYRYKDFVIPVATILICCLLFFFIIMPQIQSWLALKDAISGDSEKLATLKQNVQTISKLDDAALNTDLTLASNALPADKDFTGILQALSNAAANAGTSLGDYSLPIGDLVTNSTKVTPGVQPLQLSINLKGDMDTGKTFIDELKKQLPISDVTSITVNANNTLSLTIVFYYAALPKIAFDDSVPLTTLSPKDEAVLQLLNVSPLDTNLEQTPSTPSATPATSSAGTTHF